MGKQQATLSIADVKHPFDNATVRLHRNKQRQLILDVLMPCEEGKQRLTFVLRGKS